MNSGLVLHATTEAQLDRFAKSPTHALLLLGADGAGKGSIARLLTSGLLQLKPEKYELYPYIRTVNSETGTISIDHVRDVQKFLQLKTTGDSPIRRVICLEHTDGMAQEAQNALLKLLEEPPEDTVIIMTAQHKRALLPTILSRVQVIQILPPTYEQLADYFKAQDAENVRKAYFLSGGLPGLMQSILTEDQEHPLLQQVTTAKELLQKSAFERLALVDGVVKQKDSLYMLLDALERIAQSGLTQAAKASNDSQLKKWHALQKETFAAKDALAKNANTKLVMTNMFLNF